MKKDSVISSGDPKFIISLFCIIPPTTSSCKIFFYFLVFFYFSCLIAKKKKKSQNPRSSTVDYYINVSLKMLNFNLQRDMNYFTHVVTKASANQDA